MSARRNSSIWIPLAFCPALLLSACSDEMRPPDTPIDGEVLEISGEISQDASYSGWIHVVGDVSIPAGVTVTVAPGSEIRAAQNTFIRVEGTLMMTGSAAERVSLWPLSDDPSWGGITAEAGGTVDLSYVQGEHVSSLVFCKQGAEFCRLDHVEFAQLGSAMVTHAPSLIENSHLEDMANGGISVRDGSDLTIRDTYVLTSDHDLIVTQSGSRLTVDHSEIGGAQGSYEHCNFHIGGGEISITNSNLVASVYAMMLGGTSGAVIQYNNIMNNDTDFLEVGQNTAVDMRYNYWDRGAPDLGIAYDTSSPADSAYPDAGPRN